LNILLQTEEIAAPPVDEKYTCCQSLIKWSLKKSVYKWRENNDPGSHSLTANPLTSSFFFDVPSEMVEMCLNYLFLEDCCALFCLSNRSKSWQQFFCLERSVVFFQKCFRESVFDLTDKKLLMQPGFESTYCVLQNIQIKKNSGSSVDRLQVAVDVDAPLFGNLPEYEHLSSVTLRLLWEISYPIVEALRENEHSDSISERDKMDSSTVKRSCLPLDFLNSMDTQPQKLIKKPIHEIIGKTATNTFIGSTKVVNGYQICCIFYDCILIFCDRLYAIGFQFVEQYV
jgi:hypothetical protein